MGISPFVNHYVQDKVLMGQGWRVLILDCIDNVEEGQCSQAARTGQDPRGQARTGQDPLGQARTASHSDGDQPDGQACRGRLHGGSASPMSPGEFRLP